MKKTGIIRCRQTEEMCPGTACFSAAGSGKLAFEKMGAVEITGFITCGGCPGKKVAYRAELMVSRGIEVVAFASCLKRGGSNESKRQRNAKATPMGTQIL